MKRARFKKSTAPPTHIWSTFVVRMALPVHWKDGQRRAHVEKLLASSMPGQGVVVYIAGPQDKNDILLLEDGRTRLVQRPGVIQMLRSQSEQRAIRRTAKMLKVSDMLRRHLRRAERQLELLP